ncbi:unnamed protein product [Prorocentrum cordatum]|uniref:EF-hand domain-containing protein n=1 Tax=Prorocentrum cordatum TaxID=2364126 RepID=A0ABN9RSK7_9DINO|nr:unnamed protein product [Polarella glacialis]
MGKVVLGLTCTALAGVAGRSCFPINKLQPASQQGISFVWAQGLGVLLAQGGVTLVALGLDVLAAAGAKPESALEPSETPSGLVRGRWEARRILHLALAQGAILGCVNVTTTVAGLSPLGMAVAQPVREFCGPLDGDMALRFRLVTSCCNIAMFCTHAASLRQDAAALRRQAEMLRAEAAELRDATEKEREHQRRMQFKAFDYDGSGAVDWQELQLGLKEYWGVDLEESTVKRLISAHDDTNQGVLQFEDFCLRRMERTLREFEREDREKQAAASERERQLQEKEQARAERDAMLSEYLDTLPESNTDGK